MQAGMPSTQKASDAMLRKTKMCKFNLVGTCTKGAACSFAHRGSDLQSRPDLQKTNLCMAFERNGYCRDGAACKYAHGAEELRASVRRDHKAVRAVQIPAQPEAQTADSKPVILHGLPDSAFTLSSSISVPTPKGEAVQQFLKDNNSWGKDCLDTDDYSGILALTSHLSTTCSVASETSRSMLLPERIPSPDFTTEHLSEDVDSLSQDISTQGDTKPSMSKATHLRFQKTKMCNFYIQGKCTKGASCKFAHDRAVLQTPPDLFRTGLCIAFSKNGFCKDGEACKYAHGIDQLRTKSDPDNFEAHSAADEFVRSRELKYEIASLKRTIKNTFIHIHLPKLSTSAAHRRSTSASGRLTHSE
jgi:hypothetical protein